MRSLLLAAVAAVAITGTPAAADQAEHFRLCDGYQKPTNRGDGLNSGSALLGLAKSRQDIRRSTRHAVGEDGVEACRTALSDPLLKPEFKARRASLMQALAYHQLSQFAYDDAMATLDGMHEVTADFDQQLFQRGLGLGNRILRSYGLIKAERHAEAMAELDAIDATRPYANSVRATTDRLRLMMDDRLDYQFELLRRRAPRSPAANFEGFLLATEYGRFDDAVAFGSGMEFELPRSKGGWTVSGSADLDYKLLELRAWLAGSMAYALAATGKGEEAAAKIAAEREALAIAMEPPPPPAEGRKQKKSVVEDFEKRTRFGTNGLRALEHWDLLIELREDAPGLDLEQLRERLDGLPEKDVPVVIDLISLAAESEEGTRAELVSKLLELRQTRRKASLEIHDTELLKMLPHPEAPDNQVRFKRGGDGYFLSDNGYSRHEMDGPDDWTIRFTDAVATAATVEEFGMLAAAEEAKKRGYDSMLIQTSRLLQRTTNMYGMYGGYTGSTNSGREAQLRVRFVNAGQVPAELSGAEWRLLAADQVIGDLSSLPERPSR